MLGLSVCGLGETDGLGELDAGLGLGRGLASDGGLGIVHDRLGRLLLIFLALVSWLRWVLFDIILISF